MIWKIRNQTLECKRPLLMGILNVTPDSFSDGGRFEDPAAAVKHALKMIEDGADLIDLGGESTRPEAGLLSAQEEESRILPVLKLLRKQTSHPISIDTTKAQVALKCLEEGADIINDISGLRESGLEMAEAVKHFGAGLVIMHRRGNAQTMQSMTQYRNVTQDVMAELRLSMDFACQAGIAFDQIVVDPGLGFAKTPEQNLQILRELDRFHELGRPVLLGASRKSFIGHLTEEPASRRDYGTAAVISAAVLRGIQIFRVHSVRPMRDVITVAQAMRGEDYVRAFQMGVH